MKSSINRIRDVSFFDTLLVIVRKVLMFSLCFFAAESILSTNEIHLNFSYIIQIVFLFFWGYLYLFLALVGARKIADFPSFVRYIVTMNTREKVMLFFVVFNLIWILIIPRFNNILLSNSIAEAGMVTMLLMYFPLSKLVKEDLINERLIVKTMVIAMAFAVIEMPILWIVQRTSPASIAQFYQWIEALPIFEFNQALSGYGIVRVIKSNMVFLPVMIMLQYGSTKRPPVLAYLFVLLSVFSVLVTYLKSLWIGIIVAIIVVIIMIFTRKENRSLRKKAVGVTAFLVLSVFVLDTAVFSSTIRNRFVNMLSFNASAVCEINYGYVDEDGYCIPYDEDDRDLEGTRSSIIIRLEQIELLVEKWSESPIIGHGFGAHIDGYTRNPSIENYYLFETTPFALLMKTGVAGIATYALFIIVAMFQGFSKLPAQPFNAWIGTLIMLVITIQTNPYLFNTSTMFLILTLYLTIDYFAREKTV